MKNRFRQASRPPLTRGRADASLRSEVHVSPAFAEFPTLITPDDTWETLVEEAGIRLSSHHLLGDEDWMDRAFVPERLAEPRSVPVRLLRPEDLFDHVPELLDDLCAASRLKERGFKPISLHAFLAFLGQHRGACKRASGTTVLGGPDVEGYATVFRFYDRPGAERELQLFPMRSPSGGLKIRFIWAELFAAEPIAQAG